MKGVTMRILVMSDTHGDQHTLHRVILSQQKAEVIIHLGDGCDDIEDERYLYPDKMFLQVRGNCDWCSALPPLGEIQLENRKIFYTHGNLHNVKYSLDEIKLAARLQKANILLFGHTHVPYTEYENGLYIMNPGSLRGADASYGIVDITPQGVVTNIIRANGK